MKRASSSPASLDNPESKIQTTLRKFSEINSKKKGRFDFNRAMSDDDDASSSELEKERKRNDLLTNMVSALQEQITKLTEQVSRLNDTICSMQSEKSALLELIKAKEIPFFDPNEINTDSVHSNETDKTNESEREENRDTEAMTVDNDDNVPNERDGDTQNGDVTERNESPTATRNTNTKPNTDTIKRSNKVPPIDIWTENRAEIQRMISNKLPSDSCLFSRVNNSKFRVFPRDAYVRSTVIDFLNERNYQFNTYTPSDEKMINVIIRGLEHVDDEQIIVEELAENGFVPHKVQKYVTGYMRHNNVRPNLWLITLQPNTDTSQLFLIKAIDHAIVKFEFLKKPKVIQCKRCQRLFHSASNCKLPFRCVKCIDAHEPGNCKIDGNNKLKPKCVNCKGEHTANDFKNCPYFQKAIETQNERSNKSKPADSTKNKQTKPTTNPNMVSAKMSFADQVKQNKTEHKPKAKQSQKQSQTNSVLEKFIENQNYMMQQFMQSMSNMQQQFITSFSNGR